jgi:hypothetical protein
MSAADRTTFPLRWQATHLFVFSKRLGWSTWQLSSSGSTSKDLVFTCNSGVWNGEGGKVDETWVERGPLTPIQQTGSVLPYIERTRLHNLPQALTPFGWQKIDK